MKTLPRGLRLDHGYLQVRIMHKGQLYCKNFGAHTPESEELALIHLSDKRKEILLSKFGMNAPLPRKKFSEVAEMYVERWSKEQDADGNPQHNASSIDTVRGRVDAVLIPYFGHMYFDDIKPRDVMAWRVARVREVMGTTVNREQNILSSIFAHITEWTKLEQIKAFAIPSENPCMHVAKAKMKKRDRIVTAYEISKLKLAAHELEDDNARDNISLAVKTCLSLNDLMTLKFGEAVNLNRSKSGVAVNIPITVMHAPNWLNWRKRWDAIRERAGLKDVEFRDLRKAGGNLLLGKHDVKLISLYMGHADQKTTEAFYTKIQSSQMQALAQDLSSTVDSL